MSRIINLIFIALTLSACASTPPSALAARDASRVSCQKTEVLYCANNGSHKNQRICTCLTQNAARSMVDSL